jgi:hypothetical protein
VGRRVRSFIPVRYRGGLGGHVVDWRGVKIARKEDGVGIRTELENARDGVEADG